MGRVKGSGQRNYIVSGMIQLVGHGKAIMELWSNRIRQAVEDGKESYQRDAYLRPGDYVQ